MAIFIPLAVTLTIILNYRGSRAQAPDTIEKCLFTSFSSFDTTAPAPRCTFDLETNEELPNLSCVKPGVLLINGEYNDLRIICSAVYPLDFEFDGFIPTEAIEPHQRRNVEAIDDGHVKINEYIVDVTIHSIQSLFRKFGVSNVSSPELEPKKYSRTGEYTFRGFANERVYGRSFYIYFEEPMARKEFIRNRNVYARQGMGTNETIVPCRSTHHGAIVDLVGPPTESGPEHDKERGFQIKESFGAAGYSCRLTDTEGIVLDTLDLGISKLDYNSGGRRKDTSKVEIKVIRNKDRLQGKFTSSIECQIEETTGRTELMRIPTPNLILAKLREDFAFPAFSNRSLEVERGERSSDDTLSTLGTVTLTTLREDDDTTSGSAYCGDGEKYAHTIYGIIMVQPPFKLSLSAYISLVNSNTSSAFPIRNYFNVFASEDPKSIYEGEQVTFTCVILTFIYVPPSVWSYRFQNGTIKRAHIDYDWTWTNRTSYFVSQVPANVSQVIFEASEFRHRYWKSIEYNVTVSSPTVPKVLGERDRYVALARDATNTKLTCEAEGFPLPTVQWLKDGKESLPLGVMVSTNPSALKQRVISELTFIEGELVEEGTYFCVAGNYKAKAERRFHVSFKDDLTWVYVVVTLVVSLVAIAAAFIYFRRRANKEIKLTKTDLEEFYKGQQVVGGANEAESDYQHHMAAFRPYKQEYELPKARFRIDTGDILGCGAYGIVMRGRLDGCPVAVKTVASNAEKSYLKALLCELKIQIYLGQHLNLVQFLGAYTKDLKKGLVYIFVEFCGNGNLESFLRKHELDVKRMLQSNGNAASTEFDAGHLFTTTQLSGQFKSLLAWSIWAVIHGDLATRNILLTENLTAKITDFGLSRQLYNYAQYVKQQQEPLPWRWMALESLKNLTFSSKSDVWSYGVTLWEIFSLGQVPYPGQSWNLSFVSEIENGLRLLQPDHAPDHVYQSVMLRCWNAEPESRPTFTEIKEMLMDSTC